jgi:putative salt-induced outer membrane protein
MTNLASRVPLLGCLGALPIAWTTAALAQAPQGVMKQASATTGKSDVATETFDTAKQAAGEKDATEAKIQAGALLSTGNSRSLATTALGQLRLRRGVNELSFAAAANYARAAASADVPTKTTMENFQGRLRYDRFVSDEVAFFAGLSGRRDRFQGLALRLNLDPGVAYYFLSQPKQQLWGELGYDLQYDVRREEAITAAAAEGTLLGKTKTRHSARAFAGYRNTLNEHATFNTGLEYLQGIPKTENWRLNWDASLTVAIATKFSLGTTFSLRYDHNPLPGIESLDTVTALNLIYQLY